ncbi:MAG TPA: hypothetical protein VJ815_07905, partial [Acidimicrobiia bacterium]|nr:hypothetical protein [Acidimicrobiia bacterium]
RRAGDLLPPRPLTRLPRNAAYLERGPKRVFAGSTEWPGWSRGAKTDEAALATLTEYSARYGQVAALAGVDFEESWFREWRVVETVVGSGATDFGVPEKVVAADRRALTGATAAKWAGLLEASWEYFEDTAANAPASLRKGPRGGGRDRDAVGAHVEEAEESYGVNLGISRKLDSAARRTEIIELIAGGGSGELIKGKWTLRYAVRRITWHVLDHAWEIEDRSK